jgi:hypothetical protein
VERRLKVAAVVTATAAIVPSTASARVVGIKLTQTRVFQRVFIGPLHQTTLRRGPLPGDVVLSRYNLQWLGNRLGYAPQPWPVGVAVTACRITAYPRARCAARYTLVGGGRILAVGPLSFRTRVTQHLRIVGGTGRYRSARGSITIQHRTPTVRVLRFTVVT